MKWKAIFAVLLAGALLLLVLPLGEASGRYAWLPNTSPDNTLLKRVPTPEGWKRVELSDTSFGAWLRTLPLKPGKPPVKLYNGQNKSRQDVHQAVIDLDVGPTDLQQCADTIIRLRAEYLWTTEQKDKIAFKFTSGDLAKWSDWQKGIRPKINGNRVSWRQSAAPDKSRRAFASYLKTVFTYAGTYSLQRELKHIADPGKIQPGDVLIQGGFPGHTVLVADVIEHPQKGRRFLLLQGFMPAQEAHVLKNLHHPSLSPWYAWPEDLLNTAEWKFRAKDHYRFKTPG